MTEEQRQLIVDKLRQSGFSARADTDSILAWLNRPISKHEIEIVLAKEFEEIEFDLECNGQCVLIKGD